MTPARPRAAGGAWTWAPPRCSCRPPRRGCRVASTGVGRQVIPWPGCHVIPWLAVDVLPGLGWCCRWWRVDHFADLSGEVFGRRAAEAGGEDGLAGAAADPDEPDVPGGGAPAAGRARGGLQRPRGPLGR